TDLLQYGAGVWAAREEAEDELAACAEEERVPGRWDARTDELIGKLQHDRWVWAATFDAKGERVVTASEDKTARIWDARTGELIEIPRESGRGGPATTCESRGGGEGTQAAAKPAGSE